MALSGSYYLAILCHGKNAEKVINALRILSLDCDSPVSVSQSCGALLEAYSDRSLAVVECPKCKCRTVIGRSGIGQNMCKTCKVPFVAYVRKRHVFTKEEKAAMKQSAKRRERKRKARCHRANKRVKNGERRGPLRECYDCGLKQHIPWSSGWSRFPARCKKCGGMLGVVHQVEKERDICGD